ncbi:porin [Xylella taiwanensis]|nr:OprO/OprP family phosphate-selective porin [Xylella taiwanensis]AXI82739.1 porin [Xylella taiwanensis]MCD8455745.1 OprO/OprP family phosphate-selective porin [Xylella taiwanensis]MCD8458150.1 OprO/OprP family phosphate-selective porin [Xylella taiwanensis]MCD8460286.1 OprO/OprP family phosphate-selective porin [Xylella taiwanensis]MCD8463656.1 OprO/OprP family phosphate-selective porin [Xylella taiwanensis]
MRRLHTIFIYLLLSLAASTAHAADGSDRTVTAKLGGRLHLDFARFDNDDRGPPNRNDTEIRRFWLDVTGQFFAFDYKIEGDFTQLQDAFKSKNIDIKDVYLRRRFGETGTLTIGQFKQYFSLDDRTGSDYGQFLERSGAANTLAPQYHKAVSWQAARQNTTWEVSAYSLDSIDVSNVNGRAFGGRGTWSPGVREGDVLHLGLSLAHERYDHPGSDGMTALSIRPRPAGHLSDNSRVTLARFADGRDTKVNKWALEYAQVRGPLSWQSEYIGGIFDDGMQRATVQSAYGFVSWFVTGESRAYDRKNGRFTRIKALHHPRGALELALRYDRMWGTQHRNSQPDFLNVSTASWTLGANWYLKPNLRLMLNLIDSHNRDHLAGTTLDHTRAITGRLHYDF